jgi:hypothetical protein
VRTALVSVGFLAILCCAGARGSAPTELGTGEVVLREFSFSVPAGWSHAVAEAEEPRDSMAWVANVPVPARSSWTFPPEEMLRTLPPQGIAVTLEADVEDQFCASTSVVRLTAVEVMSGDYEGQPAEHVSSGSTYAVREGRCLFAQAWFGLSNPSEQMLGEVNHILDSIQLRD